MSSLHGVLNCLSFLHLYLLFMVVGWGLSCKPITLILYSNFEIFVTMVTGVGLRHITFADPRTAPRLFGQESKTYLLHKNWVVTNFLLQFLNFLYHGNRGRLSKVWQTELNCSIRKNPQYVQVSGGSSCTSKVIADFVLKIANFRCHGNKHMSEPNVTRIVEFADTENHT